MNNKNTEKRIRVLWEALMDIAGTNTGHPCKCQCANHCIERAQDAIKTENSWRWDTTKKDRCFDFHLPDMDRLFNGMKKWDWRSKKHLTQEWKELAASIRVSMNYSPYYGTGDILHRWFGYWKKNRERLENMRPILNGNKLIEIYDEVTTNEQ